MFGGSKTEKFTLVNQLCLKTEDMSIENPSIKSFWRNKNDIMCESLCLSECDKLESDLTTWT